MKYIKKLMFLLLPCVIESCISNSDTEIYQKKRDNIVDVHALIKEIPINDVLIGSIARPFLLGDYLLNSPLKIHHIG